MKMNSMKPHLWIVFLFAVIVTPVVFSAGEGRKTICHKGRTITVAEAAVPAHLAHGDSVGPCGVTPTLNP